MQRSAGRSAVAAAAHRAGDRLIDERLAMEFDFGSKGDIEFAATLEPDDAPAAFGDRQTLWSAAEDAAMRCPFPRRLASLSSGEPAKPHAYRATARRSRSGRDRISRTSCRRPRGRPLSASCRVSMTYVVVALPWSICPALPA